MATAGSLIAGNVPLNSTLTFNTTLSSERFFVGAHIRIIMPATTFNKQFALQRRNISDSSWSVIVGAIPETKNAIDVSYVFGNPGGTNFRPKWRLSRSGLANPIVQVYISGYGNSGSPIYYCFASPPSSATDPADFYKSNRGHEISAAWEANRVVH